MTTIRSRRALGASCLTTLQFFGFRLSGLVLPPIHAASTPSLALVSLLTPLLTLALFSSPSAQAVVDMKTANYTESWLDMMSPGSGYELRILRTYNSRVIFNGIFGFGWCSDFETKLEVTAEGNIKITECGAGSEILYTAKDFSTAKVDKVVSDILAEVKKKNPTMTDQGLKEVEKDLRTDDFFRESFAQKLGIKGTVSQDISYYANGRENETVQRQTQGFKRSLADSTYQMFDQMGRLTHLYDRSGNYLKLSYHKNNLVTVSDNNGRRLTLSYDKLTGKVARITGPNGLTATYKTDGDNLIEVVNAGGEKYVYGYDDVHNMTKIKLPNGLSKELTYNKDKDWVVGFKNESGCTEAYDYKIDPKNTRGHFWSYVTKTCSGKITNKSTYEFFHELRKDGTGLYLTKVISEVNGKSTEVVYHEVFGKPILVRQGDIQVEYSYLDSGQISIKSEPSRRLRYSYENSCGKVAKVEVEQLERNPASKGEAKVGVKGEAKVEVKGEAKVGVKGEARVVKKVTTEFQYSSKSCLLTVAQNSDGQKAQLTYDSRGRVAKIEDQSKKVLMIKYDARFGKPEVLTRPGLGTVKLFYKKNGEVDRADPGKGDPKVALQIMAVFNNLLEIISPAGLEANI